MKKSIVLIDNIYFIFSFATGCEVSPDGNKISCDCLPGYFGARCESCNAGFYGSPETPGIHFFSKFKLFTQFNLHIFFCDNHY